MLLEARDIKKSFGELQILKGIDLSINEGEIVSIMGSSGAGKTTLLQILGTLEKADSGQVKYSGQDISKLNSKKLSRFRNENIGFVFQFHHLLAEFTAIENVMMPMLIKGESKANARTNAMNLLDRLKLSHRINHKPSELSGGEQQRVATARALINTPKVIFADEPSGNLDSNNAKELHELFLTLREELKQTFIIVTHDQNLANGCDRIIVIKDGKLI